MVLGDDVTDAVILGVAPLDCVAERVDDGLGSMGAMTTPFICVLGHAANMTVATSVCVLNFSRPAPVATMTWKTPVAGSVHPVRPRPSDARLTPFESTNAALQKPGARLHDEDMDAESRVYLQKVMDGVCQSVVHRVVLFWKYMPAV